METISGRGAEGVAIDWNCLEKTAREYENIDTKKQHSRFHSLKEAA